MLSKDRSSGDFGGCDFLVSVHTVTAPESLGCLSVVESSESRIRYLSDDFG
jgi:hypothetical protein